MWLWNPVPKQLCHGLKLFSDDQEMRAIDFVLSNVTYLGRAESWVSMKVKNPPNEAQMNCMPLDAVTRVCNDSTATVTVLAPDLETWNSWSYGTNARRPNPLWNILAETKDIHSERWSQPPGSRQITYICNSELISTEQLMSQNTFKPIKIVRYVLDGKVLPLITDTIYVAEIARMRIQGIFGKKFDRTSSPIFSGKSFDGNPLAGHEHAFFLPADEDGDMRLDHLTVFSAKGFDPKRETKSA